MSMDEILHRARPKVTTRRTSKTRALLRKLDRSRTARHSPANRSPDVCSQTVVPSSAKRPSAPRPCLIFWHEPHEALPLEWRHRKPPEPGGSSSRGFLG